MTLCSFIFSKPRVCVLMCVYSSGWLRGLNGMLMGVSQDI